MANLVFLGTIIVLATSATLLRKQDAAWRWSASLVLFVVLTGLWMSGTDAPQSVWLNVPVIGGATVASMFVASLEPLQESPARAFIASLGAGLGGFFVGMLTAIEMGLLRP